MRVKLIDVHTAEVLAERTTTHSLKGDFQPGDSGQVAARLVSQCTAEALAVLAPHRKSIDIPLAGAVWGDGAGEIRAGNQLARQGRWQDAAERWRLALRKNPDNDAAKYNLGVAHEAQQRYRSGTKNGSRRPGRRRSPAVQQSAAATGPQPP